MEGFIGLSKTLKLKDQRKIKISFDVTTQSNTKSDCPCFNEILADLTEAHISREKVDKMLEDVLTQLELRIEFKKE